MPTPRRVSRLLHAAGRSTRGPWYPGVIFGPTGEVRGDLVWFDRNVYTEVLNRLDAYEGVPSLFRRVRVSVASGRGRVEAYAYEWAAEAQH